MKYALTETISEVMGVPIVERGQNHMLRCPWHVDDRPSLSIDLDTGLFICFGCGEKGGLQKLAKHMQTDVDETYVMLRALEAANGNSFYQEPPDFTELAESYHANVWSMRPGALVDYVVSRGLHGMTVRHFKLGWDPQKGRISMPFWDEDRCIGIKYRFPDGTKASETGTKRYIYNVNDVRGKAAAIICEGESDTHAIWSALYREGLHEDVGVCGIPGASVSKAQWSVFNTEFLWTPKVIVAFDADDAGKKGAAVALSVLGEKAEYRPPLSGKDYAEYLMSGGTLEKSGLRDTLAVRATE